MIEQMIELLPPEYRDEARCLFEDVRNDDEHPAEFLRKVDDFFKRLCAAEGQDYEAIFGGVRGKMRHMIAQGVDHD